MSWYFISEWLLYLCFGLLVGTQILSFVSPAHRPEYKVEAVWIRWSIGLIMALSFFPLLKVVWMFSEGNDVGFGVLFKAVLFDFNVGQAWIISLFAGNCMLLLVQIKKYTNVRWVDGLSAWLTLILIIAFAFASHCTVSYQWTGFFAHGIHFLAVTVWMGILFVIGWFAQNHRNWLAFLRWFTPLAIVCFVVVLVTGLTLMSWLVPDVVNSWIVPYGQALLIKHLLIVPLLVMALVNSVYGRRKMKRDPLYNPLPFVRAESLIGMAVFAAMAVLGQQSPTENLKAVIQFDQPSRLFDWFYTPIITPETTIQLVPTGTSVLMGILALVCLAGMMGVVIKRERLMVGLGFGLLFVCSAYLGLMFSIQ